MSFDRLQAYPGGPKFGFTGGRLANGGTFGAYTSSAQALQAWINDFQGTRFLWRKGGTSAIPSSIPGQWTASALIIGPEPAQAYNPDEMNNSFDSNDAFATAPRIANAVVFSSASPTSPKNVFSDARDLAVQAYPEALLFEAVMGYDAATGNFTCELIVYPDAASAIAETPANGPASFASTSAYAWMPKLENLRFFQNFDLSSATACSGLVISLTAGSPGGNLLRTGIVFDAGTGNYAAWAVYAEKAEDTYL